jgi:hypothetical protein
VVATITIQGLDQTLKIVTDLSQITNMPRLLTRLGLFTMERIKTRTIEKGVGPDGPWPGKRAHYSPQYAALRKQQQQPIDHVYLMWTGGMMAAMTTDVRPGNELWIYFRPTPANPIRLQPAPIRRTKKRRSVEEWNERLQKQKRRKTRTIMPRITEAQKAYHLHRYRPFFLLGEQDMDKIAQQTGKYINEEILEGGRR